MEDKDRSNIHKRNEDSEKTMSELMGLLQGPNHQASENLPASPFPNIYIVGCARSGSTFIHQFLINHFNVSYPSNFLSRFYFAPYVGAKIQYLMDNLDLKGELLHNTNSKDFQSKLGKTKGALSPHEFTFFWRQYFKMNSEGYVDYQNDEQVSSFLDGINSIKNVFNNAFVLKGIIANNCINQFIKNRPNDLIVFVHRDVAYNAQSLIEARMEFFNDASKWYSFGVPGEINFDQMSPEEQTVLQVVETNKLIKNQLKLTPNQVIEVNYDQLDTALPDLINKLKDKGIEGKEDHVDSFIPQNNIRISPKSWDSIQGFVSKYS